MAIEWANTNLWIAIGTMGLLIATLLLAWVGWHQIGQLRRENKKWRTIEVCDLYDRDPIFHACLKEIRRYKLNKLTKIINNLDVRTEIVSILNYLDGIAIGVDQGLYLEKIVKDHLGNIIMSHVRDHINSDDAKGVFGISSENYAHLISLHDKWVNEDKPHPKTSFKDN